MRDTLRYNRLAHVGKKRADDKLCGTCGVSLYCQCTLLPSDCTGGRSSEAAYQYEEDLVRSNLSK